VRGEIAMFVFDFISEKMYNKNTKARDTFSSPGLWRDHFIQLPRKKGNDMKYQVHRLDVKEGTAQEMLERFLNQLEGEVLSIIPYTTPKFQGMGATSKVDFLLIVEKTK
jgi:hypothetical protein